MSRLLAGSLSLLLSLLAHTLLLSLTFGGQEPGLPRFGFPWQDRRGEVPDLHIVLAPAEAPPVEPVVAARPPPREATAVAILPAAKPVAQAKPAADYHPHLQ